MLDHSRFLVLSEVLVDDAPVCPSALLARVSDDGRIVEARAYLTDEEMLVEAGIVSGSARRAVSREPADLPRSDGSRPVARGGQGSVRARSRAA